MPDTDPLADVLRRVDRAVRVVAAYEDMALAAREHIAAENTCSCGQTYETYEGPEMDCPLHGAVRAFNEARAEVERLRSEIERHFDYCPAPPKEWRDRYQTMTDDPCLGALHGAENQRNTP